jgi:hypothetical protein
MSAHNGKTSFPANQEHPGLRAVVLLFFFGAVFLFIWLLNLLLTNPDGSRADLANLILCGGTLPLAFGATWVLEKLLKRYWPSGDGLEIAGQVLTAHFRDGPPREIDLQSPPVTLYWEFTLRGFQRGGRERRVARNWVCLALQLTQGKQRIIVHTYLPSRKAEQLRERVKAEVQFHQINPAEVYDTSLGNRITPPTRPEIPAAVLAGGDGRYWLAERTRWQEGLELSPDKFTQFLQFLIQS